MTPKTGLFSASIVKRGTIRSFLFFLIFTVAARETVRAAIPAAAMDLER